VSGFVYRVNADALVFIKTNYTLSALWRRFFIYFKSYIILINVYNHNRIADFSGRWQLQRRLVISELPSSMALTQGLSLRRARDALRLNNFHTNAEGRWLDPLSGLRPAQGIGGVRSSHAAGGRMRPSPNGDVLYNFLAAQARRV
jgi:hypothetical protein